jgi:SAM-dependent methyltransferase
VTALVRKCPVCHSSDTKPYGRRKRWFLSQCVDCYIVYRTVFPSEAELNEIYGSDYYDSWNIEADTDAFWDMKVQNCISYLRSLNQYVAEQGNRTLLDVGCAHGFMLDAAGQEGYVPSGLEISPAGDVARNRGFRVLSSQLEDDPFPSESFDVVTMVDVVEHLADPQSALRSVWKMLKPGGVIFMVTPDITSVSARILRDAWPHYLPEHLIYYSPRPMEKLLDLSNIDVLKIGPGYKYLTVNYILGHLRYSSGGIVAGALSALASVAPSWITQKPLRYLTEMIAIGRKSNN